MRGAFEQAAKLSEVERLAGKAFIQLRIGGRIIRGKFLHDRRDENSVGEDVGVAVAEDELKLFDGAEAAPDSGSDTDKRGGFVLKAFGEFEQVDEIFEHTGEGTVVFGEDDVQAGRIEDFLLDELECQGFG